MSKGDTVVCVICRKPFIANVSNQITCSQPCRNAQHKLKTIQSQKTPRFVKNCEECGNEFRCFGQTQRFCNRKCASKYLAVNTKFHYLDGGISPEEIREQDSAFCAAMIAAGYKMTGPDTRPGTLQPYDLTRDWRPPVRQHSYQAV